MAEARQRDPPDARSVRKPVPKTCAKSNARQSDTLRWVGDYARDCLPTGARAVGTAARESIQRDGLQTYQQNFVTPGRYRFIGEEISYVDGGRTGNWSAKLRISFSHSGSSCGRRR